MSAERTARTPLEPDPVNQPVRNHSGGLQSMWIQDSLQTSGPEPIGPEPNPNLLIVAERRDFFRGCLTSWLKSSCRDLEILAVGDIEPLTECQLTQAAAALIVLGSSGSGDGWLQRQVEALGTRSPALPLVLVADTTGAEQPRELADLVGRFGLRGIIPMSTSPTVAEAALRLVIAGGDYLPALSHPVPSSGWTSTVQVRPDDTETRLRMLSPREELVMRELAGGAQNKIIAYRLGMSVNTVKVHVHNIIQKLKVHNRTEAVVVARDMSPTLSNGKVAARANWGAHSAALKYCVGQNSGSSRARNVRHPSK